LDWNRKTKAVLLRTATLFTLTGNTYNIPEYLVLIVKEAGILGKDFREVITTYYHNCYFAALVLTVLSLGMTGDQEEELLRVTNA
jgi:hypothetical protein